MHILLIHQAFVTTGEAGGTRHIEFARFLAARGHRMTIITSPVSYLTGEAKSSHVAKRVTLEPGIDVLYAYTSQGMHKGFFSRLIAFFSFMFAAFFLALRVKDVDIVWGTSPNLFQAVSAWAAARVKRVKFLLEIRDLWPAFAIDMGVLKNPLLIRLSLFLEKFLYRHADQVMVNSPGFLTHIHNVSGRDAVLIPNGADPAMFVSVGDDGLFRAHHGLEGKFVVMYTGAHGPANDLDIVLDAAALLAAFADGARVRFVLVGSGKEKSSLREKAKALKLDSVLFLPPVAKNEMAGVIDAADAGLAILKPIPMFKTTYPNKVFDFMAAGKPVICQIDGVIRTVVEENYAGVFISPGDAAALAGAVMELARDPERCHAMGRNGRNAVERGFSREVISAQLESLLEKLIQA